MTTKPLDTVGQNVQALHRTSGGATPSAKQVARRAAKIKNKRPGGLGGLFSDFGDLIASAPSGLAEMVKSGATEAEHYGPWHVATGLARGDLHEAIQGVPGVGAGVGIAEGLAQGATGDPNAVENHPLSGMQGGSFRNTYEDVIHPTRFAHAYEEGKLVSKLVEDAANISLVGGAAAKALDVGAAGSFSEAANASKAADAAERAVAPTEAQAVKAAKLAGEHERVVEQLKAALDEAPHPAKGAIRNQLDRADALARDARGAADTAQQGASQAQARALGAREQASALHAQASGPLYGAYRVAHAVAELGGQGANLPAKPFELASKGFSAVVKKFLGENPALRDALAAADERIGQAQALTDSKVRQKVLGVQRQGVKAAKASANFAERRQLASRVRTIEGNAAQDALHVGNAMDTIKRITVDDVTWQTAQLHAAGVGHAVADQARVLGENPATMAGLGDRLDEVAKSLHMDPQAVRNAVDIANGSADPVLVQRVNAANAVWDQRVAPWLESHITTDTQGLRRSPTSAQEAYARWATTKSADLPPGVEARLQSVFDEEKARLEAQREVQAKKVETKAEKAGVTPGATGAEAERQAAATAAQGATGRGALGPLREMQQAARAEGRAQASRSAAERVRAIQDAIPGLSDATVHQLVDAVDRFRSSTEALHSAQAAVALDEGLGGAPGRATLAGQVRDVRGQMVAVAQAELGTLGDLPVDRLPYVPGDLSEYHAQLHEGIAGRETGVKATFDRLRGQKANARLTDVDVFRKAYDQSWNKLAPALRNSLEKLDDAQVRQMFERWRAGTLSEFAGGLDTMATEFLGDRASGVPSEDVGRLLSEYQRKAELERLVKEAKGNRWGPDTADKFRAVLRDPEALALLDDPAVHIALTANNLPGAVEGLASMRQEQAQSFAPPDAGALASAMDEMGAQVGADDTAGLMRMVERAYGDPAATAEFFDRWTAAGSPDLAQSLIDVEAGRTPEWLAPETAPAAATTADSLGALRGAEAARSEIGQVLATQGGQAVAADLGREAGLLTGQATRAEGVAARGAGAEQAAVEGLTQTGALKGAKAGKRLAKYEKALRDLKLTDKQIAGLPDAHQKALDDLYHEITNAPAHARPALVVAQQFSHSIADWRAEMVASGADAETLRTFDQALGMGINDVRDIYAQKVSGPGGVLTEAPPKFETEYRPGGQPLRLREERAAISTARPTARPVRATLAPEQRMKETAQLPRTVDEMRVVLRDRIQSHTRNEAARMVASMYGRRAEGVLGDFGIDAETFAQMKPAEVLAEMADRHYVPWDPEALIQRVQAKDIGPGTLWLPEYVQRAVENYYGRGGGLERFMRKYYDKPITFWKAAVLALRPAWHVNNILSNSLMAMIGTGMDPVTYARRMRQSYALLRTGEASLDVALPEGVARTGPFSALRERRAVSPKRLGRLQARVGTIEPATLEAIGGASEARAPGTLVEGGGGAAMTQPGELKDLLQDPGRLRRFVNASYELNGAVDDMNRVAVFLEQRKKLTGADLDNLVARNPELAGLSRDRLRTEGAVRLSLRVAGDFLRMTPVERQVFRRVFPFYVWMRHITGLTGHLVAFHPLRVAWGLHVAQMLGTPGEFGLAAALPTGPDTVIQPPSFVPFGDASSPSPDQLGFNLSPALKVPVGAAFGLDLNRMTQFQRPPGQPGGYGGDPGMTPLIGGGGVRFGELANLVGNQFPQARALRGITDTVTEGKPVMRYPLGQIRRTSKTAGRRALASGEPMLGPLARYLGIPYERGPNPYEAPELKAGDEELKRRKKKAGRT